jgi:hypothetical protein
MVRDHVYVPDAGGAILRAVEPAPETVLGERVGESVLTPAGRVDRYGVALGLLVATISLEFVVVPGTWSAVIAIVLGAAALMFVMTASDAGRPLVLVSRAIAIGSVAVALVSAITEVPTPGGVLPLLGAALAFLTPIPIARRLLRQSTITFHTVAGALCLYLLAGLCLAHLFHAIDEIGGPVFTQLADARLADTIYFSFVTLATLGYGDLTPAPDIARQLAILEAIGGQLYLVTVIAVLVSKLGATRAGPDR